jgi:hypothetical protein
MENKDNNSDVNTVDKNTIKKFDKIKYMKQWRENNKDRIKEYRDKDVNKLYQKEYRERNREKINQQKYKYYRKKQAEKKALQIQQEMSNNKSNDESNDESLVLTPEELEIDNP